MIDQYNQSCASLLGSPQGWNEIALNEEEQRCVSYAYKHLEESLFSSITSGDVLIRFRNIYIWEHASGEIWFTRSGDREPECLTISSADSVSKTVQLESGDRFSIYTSSIARYGDYAAGAEWSDAFYGVRHHTGDEIEFKGSKPYLFESVLGVLEEITTNA